jgi:hypothetical protein
MTKCFHSFVDSIRSLKNPSVIVNKRWGLVWLICFLGLSAGAIHFETVYATSIEKDFVRCTSLDLTTIYTIGGNCSGPKYNDNKPLQVTSYYISIFTGSLTLIINQLMLDPKVRKLSSMLSSISKTAFVIRLFAASNMLPVSSSIDVNGNLEATYVSITLGASWGNAFISLFLTLVSLISMWAFTKDKAIDVETQKKEERIGKIPMGFFVILVGLCIYSLWVSLISHWMYMSSLSEGIEYFLQPRGPAAVRYTFYVYGLMIMTFVENWLILNWFEIADDVKNPRTSVLSKISM